MHASPTTVVAAVIRKEGRYLLTRRAPGAANAGLWEFPGGKVEDGETPEQSLIREIREELGIRIDVGSLLATIEHPHAGRPVRLLFYAAAGDTGAMRLRDHDTVAWASREDLAGYIFTPADREFVDQIAAQEHADQEEP
jgi:8-oxo-dGTP diphosphatase